MLALPNPFRSSAGIDFALWHKSRRAVTTALAVKRVPVSVPSAVPVAPAVKRPARPGKTRGTVSAMFYVLIEVPDAVYACRYKIVDGQPVPARRQKRIVLHKLAHWQLSLQRNGWQERHCADYGRVYWLNC
jgi:hypothetical protein